MEEEEEEEEVEVEEEEEERRMCPIYPNCLDSKPLERKCVSWTAPPLFAPFFIRAESAHTF